MNGFLLKVDWKCLCRRVVVEIMRDGKDCVIFRFQASVVSVRASNTYVIKELSESFFEVGRNFDCNLKFRYYEISV